MRDAQRPLRLAIYGLLNNQATYNGSPVGLFDEKKKVGSTANVYAIFGTQVSTPEHTSEYWITRETIDIEITHKAEFEVTKDFVDDISDQYYQLLMPARLNDALPDPSLMQIQNVELERAFTRSVAVTDTQTVIQKIITLVCLVVQQNP